MQEKIIKTSLWLISFVLPILVVVGYETENLGLTNIIDGQVTMKPATYYCSFIMCALMLCRNKYLAFYLITVCFHVLSAWVFNKVAPAFVPSYEAELPFMSVVSGLPSWATMLSFALIGLGVLLRNKGLLVAPFFIGMFSLLGYLLQKDWMKFLVEDWSTAMAINTATVIICGASYLYIQDERTIIESWIKKNKL